MCVVMEMTVYIDVLFAVNFAVNFLLLVATAVVCSARVSARRVFAAATLGALYCVCVFFPHMHIFYSTAVKLLVGVVLVVVAFDVRSAREALKKAAIFYAVTLVFGGGALAVFTMSGAGAGANALYSNGVLYAELPISVLALAVCAIYAVLYITQKLLRDNAMRTRFMRTVTIHCMGKCVEITALLDTGNSLCDPFDGTPVIVAEYEAIEKIIPETAKCLFKGGGDYCGKAAPLRIIPFHAVGVQGGVLLGFLPDEVFLDGQSAPKCVVCAYEGRLAADGSYRALINPTLTGGMDND
ncbi:MAG: sigma-E processing peptidase SpoIIGA [Clostridia bacterium]|nr:sigma-E processing peptidase SpoIIGA [Clostridia bacterium]